MRHSHNKNNLRGILYTRSNHFYPKKSKNTRTLFFLKKKIVQQSSFSTQLFLKKNLPPKLMIGASLPVENILLIFTQNPIPNFLDTKDH